MAKNLAPPDEVEEPATEEVAVDAVPEVAETSAAPVPAKRPLGVKEPIEFKWKVIGRAAGMILTLFKAVERPDADAQFERLSREGYYKDLEVVESSMKIEQPPQPKLAGKKAPAKVEAAPTRSRPATAVSTAMAVKKPLKVTARPPSKKTAAVKSTAKPAAKPAPKAAAKASKKKPAPGKKPAKAK